VYVAMMSGVREPGAVLVFAIVGLLPATVVASAWSSSSQLRQRLRSLIRLPGSTGWYGVALLVPPTVLALGAQLTALAGGQILSTPEPPPAGASVLGFTVVSFAYTLLYAGGLNEEIGWTGFALRRLLRVSGRGKLPVGGHEKSPVVAMKIPRWWPPDLPTS
jgi:membrane protease YdiL (CAAX protease family)